MQGMKEIYRINPALVGGIIGNLIGLVLLKIMS